MRRRRNQRAGFLRPTDEPTRSAAAGSSPWRPSLPAGLTVAAFLAHLRAGSLPEGPRSELIGGVITSPARLAPNEAAALVRLEHALSSALAGSEASESAVELQGVVVTRAPAFRLGPTDLLRADLAVSRLSAGSGVMGGSLEPRAALLVVEVARGRLSHEVRAPLYAAAGAKELWLLEVGRGWAEVLRSPWRGLYRSRTLWYPGEAVPVSQLGVEVEAMQRS